MLGGARRVGVLRWNGDLGEVSGVYLDDFV
jgi:hypothetical protein